MAACGLMLGIACHACSAPCDERSALHALSNGQKRMDTTANFYCVKIGQVTTN